MCPGVQSVRVLLVLLFMSMGTEHVMTANCNLTLADIEPYWDNSSYTCRGRCREAIQPLPCRCDDRCVIYGDCCEDYHAVCGQEGEMEGKGEVIAEEREGSNDTDAGLSVYETETDVPSVSVLWTDRPGAMNPRPEHAECRHRARVIAKCPLISVTRFAWPAEYKGREIGWSEAVEGCQTPWQERGDNDILAMLPVTDNDSGHHFANVYCLLCHGGRAGDAEQWALAFLWNFKLLFRREMNNLHDVLQLAKELKVPSVGEPPMSVVARRCLNVEPDPCDCPNLQRACEQGVDAYILNGRALYRNVHCLLCGMRSDPEKSYIKSPDMESIVHQKNSFTFLMLMRWKSVGPKDEEGSVLLSARNGRSVAWQDMACSFSPAGKTPPDGASGSLDNTGEHAGDTTDQPGTLDYPQLSQARPEDSPGFQDATNQSGHRTGTDNDDILLTRAVNGSDGDLYEDREMAESRDLAENGVAREIPRNFSELSTNETGSNELGQLDPHTPASHTENAVCTHSACAANIAMVDSVCRSDLQMFSLALDMFCNSPRTPPEVDKGSESPKDQVTQATVPHILQDQPVSVSLSTTPNHTWISEELKKGIQDILDDIAENVVNVTAVESYSSPDECHWSITGTLLTMTGQTSATLDARANITAKMYTVVERVLGEDLGMKLDDFEVCGRLIVGSVVANRTSISPVGRCEFSLSKDESQTPTSGNVNGAEGVLPPLPVLATCTTLVATLAMI